MNKVPIILLNYNSLPDCRKCVSSLQRQEGVELEIIVVDNCSSREGEQEAVRQFCQEQGCTFIAAEENRGYNAGNNIGLRYVAEKGYQYALIANPDMEFPQNDYIARLVEAMSRDKDIVVVGSDIVGLDGIHQNPLVRNGNWRSSFGWITGLFKRKKADACDFIDRYQESHYCAKVSGCCLLVRMDFIQSIGFFDEYPFLYCEEAILSRQVEQVDKSMYYVADMQAIHAHVKTEKGDPTKRFHHWRRSSIYFIKKYSGGHWIGRQLAILSIKLYVAIFCFVQWLKR